jgi:hypothetical protein
MMGIAGGIGDAAPGFFAPADDDDRKPLSGLTCQGAYQENRACSVTAQDKCSAAHEMLLASDEKIKKATAKFSSDNNLGATSALKVRAIDLFSDDEKISQGHDVASIDNLRQH